MAVMSSFSASHHRRPMAPDLALHGPALAGAGSGRDLARDMLAARQAQRALPLPLDAGAALTPQEGYELQALHVQSVLDSLGGRVIGTRIGAGDMASLA